ncbi:MAG: hypothetical protein AAF366_14085 [Pseudomonadota bacterium]
MDLGNAMTQLVAVMNLSVPVPDMVLVLASMAAIAVISISARRSQRAAVAHAESVYLEELTRANRQAQAAESKLRAVRSEMEKYRRRAKGH